MERILIVEDSENIVNFVKKVLIKMNKNFEIFVANDGREAFEIIVNNSNIDLILLDIMMPEVSGEKFLKAFGNFRDKFKCKICMMTSLDRLGLVEKLINYGIEDYLVKPFDKNTLVSKVSKILFNDETFKEINLSEHGKISSLNEEIISKINILKLSENSVLFNSENKITNKSLLLSSRCLKDYNIDHLLLILKSSEKEKNLFITEAVIVLLNSNVEKNLRNFIIHQKRSV